MSETVKNEEIHSEESSRNVKSIEVHMHLKDGSTKVQPLDYLFGAGVCDSTEEGRFQVTIMEIGSCTNLASLSVKDSLLKNISTSEILLMSEMLPSIVHTEQTETEEA